MANSVKHHGRVYTPDYLVRTILDFGNYNGKDIVEKHVIGVSQFSMTIYHRYHLEWLKHHIFLKL